MGKRAMKTFTQETSVTHFETISFPLALQARTCEIFGFLVVFFLWNWKGNQNHVIFILK